MKKIGCLCLLGLPGLIVVIILMVFVGGASQQSTGAQEVDGVTYVDHWSDGDAYSHNLLKQRYGIKAEQLDGFLDSTGVKYDKSRINGKLLLEWQSASGLDVRAIVAIAMMESSLGTAGVATKPGANMFGYGAYDSNPDNATNYSDEKAVTGLTKVTIIENKNETFKVQDEKAKKNANGTLNPAKDGGVYFTDTSGSGKKRAEVMEKLDKWIDDHGGTPKAPASGGGGKRPNGKFAHIFDTSYTVLQPYGYTAWSRSSSLYASTGGKHTGVDVVADNVTDGKDTPVYSITDGTVYSVSYSSLGGHAVTIKVEGGYLYYGHLKYEATVRTGDQVKAGQKIAVLGHSGMTDIYHVHLEYSVEPYMSTNKGYDRDPSFLFQESGSLQQNQKITP